MRKDEGRKIRLAFTFAHILKREFSIMSLKQRARGTLRCVIICVLMI